MAKTLITEDYEVSGKVKGYGTQCKVLVDPGEKYCPKHKLQSLLEAKPEAHA